jgi:Polyketide cyclase / dehydrase and lipid transport
VTVKLREVSLDFLDVAPKRWSFEAPVGAPQADVFAAISADPGTWTWFPGITGGGYSGPEPFGAGTVREARMGPSVYRETILVWDAPERWVYRVDEMTVPLAHALVEDWTVAPAGPGSVVRWTFAIDPRPLFRASMAVAPAAMGHLFRRAMSNLGRSLNGRP